MHENVKMKSISLYANQEKIKDYIIKGQELVVWWGEMLSASPYLK